MNQSSCSCCLTPARRMQPANAMTRAANPSGDFFVVATGTSAAFCGDEPAGVCTDTDSLVPVALPGVMFVLSGDLLTDTGAPS